MSDDKPVAIVAIDNEAKIRAGAAAVRHIVREGMIAVSNVEVILSGEWRSELS